MNNTMFYSQKKCSTCGVDFKLIGDLSSQTSKKSNDFNDAINSFHEACDLIKQILKSGKLDGDVLEETISWLSDCYGYEDWVENFRNGIILEDEEETDEEELN